jgi:cell wall-associated NlpC family hydrolase
MDARQLLVRHPLRLVTIILIAMAAAILAVDLLGANPDSSGSRPAPASSSQEITLLAYYQSPGNRALNWAESQRGAPYVWGGTGPWGYDCSGLVYEAFLHAGINISRDTYTQLRSWGNGHFHFVPWGREQRGDIAFFGTGHEELVTAWWHGTFGALNSGTYVTWHTWSGWWQPTMFVRIWLP